MPKFYSDPGQALPPEMKSKCKILLFVFFFLLLLQIRSQRDSQPVPYLYLPDEILLQIFSFLPHKDLVSCSQVCSQFCRISMDETLCKSFLIIKVFGCIINFNLLQLLLL